MASANSIYKAKRASNQANPTAATCFKQADDSTRAANVIFEPPVASPTSARFRVRAYGKVTTGTSSTFIATIQYSSDANSTGAATAANNTDCKALTSRTLATITRSWSIDAELLWDSTSQRLTGQGNGVNSETIETANAIITALTAVDLSTGKCGFVVSCIFGSTNASNVATLDDFSLEVM